MQPTDASRKIISVSRRTDIPAFYGPWFQRRLEEGFAGWENPFGGQRYLVSLKREDVAAFVFCAVRYGKVQRNFKRCEVEHGLAFVELSEAEREALSQRLADIAAAHDIALFTCCGDALIGGRIRKAHCIDGELLATLYGDDIRSAGGGKPTRKECGCAASTDIGAYDTCPHGCIYCYANVNPARAAKSWQAHDPASAFLGAGRDPAARFVEALRARPPDPSA